MVILEVQALGHEVIVDEVIARRLRAEGGLIERQIDRNRRGRDVPRNRRSSTRLSRRRVFLVEPAWSRWSRKGPLCGKRGGHPRHRRLRERKPISFNAPSCARASFLRSRVESLSLASSSLSASYPLRLRDPLPFILLWHLLWRVIYRKRNGG